MRRVLHGPLPPIEIFPYVAVWVTSAAYCTYCLFTASKDHAHEFHSYDFEKGWTLTGRKKDISDFEWRFWRAAVKFLLPGMVIHSLIGQLISRTLPQYKAHCSLVFTLVFLFAFLGLRPMLFMIGHCLFIYICALTQSTAVVWIGSLSILASLQLGDEFRYWQFSFLSSDEAHRNFILFFCLMSNLRCISFALEYCWFKDPGDKKDQPVQRYTFLDMLVYNFYFPLFANGPVVTFDSFHRTFYSCPVTFSRPVVLSLVWDSLRTLGWACFLEFYLQFFYSSAISRDPLIFQALGTWTLTGVMYSQLNIFLTKYVVFYRCSGVFARLDNLDPPKAPRCVSTLYLFGDMWSYFDRGLYVWIKRYIYVPLGGSQRGVFMQLVASFSTFCFIWCWHGGYQSQLWWFIPNWLGIVAEAIGGRVLQVPAVKDREAQLSPAMSRRIRGAFGTITVVTLILSNLVFLIGVEPVWFYTKKVFYDGFPVGPATLCVVMYCCAQTSMELNRHKAEW